MSLQLQDGWTGYRLVSGGQEHTGIHILSEGDAQEQEDDNQEEQGYHDDQEEEEQEEEIYEVKLAELEEGEVGDLQLDWSGSIRAAMSTAVSHVGTDTGPQAQEKVSTYLDEGMSPNQEQKMSIYMQEEKSILPEEEVSTFPEEDMSTYQPFPDRELVPTTKEKMAHSKLFMEEGQEQEPQYGPSVGKAFHVIMKSPPILPLHDPSLSEVEGPVIQDNSLDSLGAISQDDGQQHPDYISNSADYRSNSAYLPDLPVITSNERSLHPSLQPSLGDGGVFQSPFFLSPGFSQVLTTVHRPVSVIL